jgi:hypothetical protein
MLWSDRGTQAREYLSGSGLREETIPPARLGYCSKDEWIEGIYTDCKVWVARGIIIPWFDGTDETLINVRRLEGDPKYIAVRGNRRSGAADEESQCVMLRSVAAPKSTPNRSARGPAGSRSQK